MSLHPDSSTLFVPNKTARVVRAAFLKGSPYLTSQDALGAVFCDRDFADLYPLVLSRPTRALATAHVMLMHFREGLRDRQAAEAVWAHID